jgi:hypothetical protein
MIRLRGRTTSRRIRGETTTVGEPTWEVLGELARKMEDACECGESEPTPEE